IFFFQAEDGIRDFHVTGVQTCALPISAARSVDQKLIWSARAAGTSRAACLWKVTLPAIVPTVLAGVRVAGVIACVVVFLAEMIEIGRASCRERMEQQDVRLTVQQKNNQ